MIDWHIRLFLLSKNQIFSALSEWMWLLAVIIGVTVAIILNRDIIKDIISSQNPRFCISKNRKEFDKTFAKNQAVKSMIKNGETGFVNCAYCKHIKNCKKCSETDYDIADTVCGDYEL